MDNSPPYCSTSYIIFKGPKRLTLKEEDMFVEKIARIFQVYPPSLYITDDKNVAIFPQPDGHFSSFDLRPRGHYEVNGDDIALPVADQSPPVPGGSGQNRFQFQRPSKPTAALGPPAQAATFRATMNSSFNRPVLIADLHQGKLRPIRTISVRLFEFEATVVGVLAKVYEAVPLILTDAHGSEIVDCEGTRGSTYWKPKSSKFFAVPEPVHRELKKTTKRWSPKGLDDGLQEVHEKMEEVIMAAQGQCEVTAVMKELSTFASNTTDTMLVFSNTATAQMKAAFECYICKGQMEEPMYAVCCNTLLGCKTCIVQWMLLHPPDNCLKCRTHLFSVNVHRVTSLDNFLAILGGIMKPE